MIEEFIGGREIQVAILGNRKLGVFILFFINNFFDISLSIAIADGITPEWVYGILRKSQF